MVRRTYRGGQIPVFEGSRSQMGYGMRGAGTGQYLRQFIQKRPTTDQKWSQKSGKRSAENGRRHRTGCLEWAEYKKGDQEKGRSDREKRRQESLQKVQRGGKRRKLTSASFRVGRLESRKGLKRRSASRSTSTTKRHRQRDIFDL